MLRFRVCPPEAPDEAVKPEPLRSSKNQAQVRRTIVSGAVLTSPYIFMNSLATVVASYGLLANSAAVVIGAMIIAMLLGPIMGLALAIVDGDTRLLRGALTAEIIGAAIALMLGAFIGFVHADLPITSEILVRTKPNLLDLMIALAGGAAAAYATVSPRIAVGLVGAAIATALVPPLASCGICLSRGLFPQAGGAFILFATNLVAIQCAASAVLFAFGFHRVTQRAPDDRNYVRRLAIDATLFLALAVFLYMQLAATVTEKQFEEAVSTQLEKGLLEIPGAYLAETRFVSEKNATVVVAVVRVPNSITPKQTAKLQLNLPSRDGKKTELHVRSMLTKETTADGYLHELEPAAPPADEVLTPQAAQAESGATTEPLPQVVLPRRS